tara:strand:+ start:262313 stop:264670 length:2358 start_codon:yes stop_codon:yes gene_type:complete
MRSLVKFFCLFVVLSFGAQAREAERGIIDLRAFNFSQGKAQLEGEWEFYWERLITPEQFKYAAPAPDYFMFPKLWNDSKTAGGVELSSQGFATYRVKLLLPQQTPPLSIAISHFYSDYDLYVDGQLLGENGVVGNTKETSEPHWIPKTLRILPSSDTLELVLHISNFHHSKGGAREPILLGARDRIMHDSLFNISYDLLLSGCLIMAGLFFLGLYLFGQKENYIIAFGLFCLVFSYRFFGADNYALHILYPDIPWTVTLHFEYLALFLAPSLFAIYSYTLFPKDGSLIILGGFAGLSGLLSLLTLVLPSTTFTLFVEPYLFVMVAVIAYVSYVYAAAARFNRDGANYALASTMVVLLVFIYKIYVYLALEPENRLLTFIGFISFFFFQSLNMFFRVTRSLRVAKEEAEEASRTKSDFLSMMSHEIRTPMNAVIGLTNYMIGDKPKKEHKEALNTLKFSAENLLVILNDILDLNKIEANRIEFEKMPVNIRQLTARLKQVFERIADERGLYIKVSVDETITQSIVCDSTRTSQVLSNLISNALKFTKEGGIELIVNELDRDEGHITLRFAIKDTGIGISMADQQKIFDSFTQASTSVTREYGGTGLGLTITRRLLNLQGVQLGLNSEKGKGSEFYFIQRFETVDHAVEEDEALADGVESGNKGANILLVEDNKVNVLVAQKFLKKWEFGIEIAANGAEAVDKVKNKKYDLILMDLQMPVMDGYEASRQIRALGINTPIIALTASTMMEDRDKVKRFGMNDHIIKPFDPEDLKKKVNKYITNSVIDQ